MAIQAAYYSEIGFVYDANRNAGFHFFSPDTMRFFRTRVHNALYGGSTFVTSEQFAFNGRTEPREYRVRVAMADGSIKSLDSRFKTRALAHENAKWLGNALRNGSVTCDPQTGDFTYHSVYGDAPVELS